MDYETEFSAYNTEDYKRCVCWSWGDGAADCMQEYKPRCEWQNDEETKASLIDIFVPKEGDKLKINATQAIVDLALSSCQFLVFGEF